MDARKYVVHTGTEQIEIEANDMEMERDGSLRLRSTEDRPSELRYVAVFAPGSWMHVTEVGMAVSTPTKARKINPRDRWKHDIDRSFSQT